MLNRRLFADKAFTLIVWIIGTISILPLIHIIYILTVRGLPVVIGEGLSIISSLPAAPGSAVTGGLAPAIVGTLETTAISVMTGFPIAVFTAVFLYEYGSTRLGKITRMIVMSLMEIPTVLIGMLVYVLIVLPFKGFSVFAGGIALSIVILPYATVYVENSLKQVPFKYREAAFSLGLTRRQTVFHVLTGIAKKGVLASLLISTAKSMGETAPLLFTIGGARSTVSLDPFRPGDSVSLLVFQFASTPYSNWVSLAWAGAFILASSILLVNLAVKIIVKEVRY